MPSESRRATEPGISFSSAEPASLASSREDPIPDGVTAALVDQRQQLRAIAGIDLVAQYGLYGSQAFPDSPPPEVVPTAIAPGDLAVYSPVNGVGHIVMIHHIDADGTVHTIEASTSRGVHIGSLNWARVTSIKRPAPASDDLSPSSWTEASRPLSPVSVP